MERWQIQSRVPSNWPGVLNQLVERKVSDIYVCAGKNHPCSRRTAKSVPRPSSRPTRTALVAFLNQAGETVIKGAITRCRNSTRKDR